MTQLTDEELSAICEQNKGKTWLEGIRAIISAHEAKQAKECEPVDGFIVNKHGSLVSVSHGKEDEVVAISGGSRLYTRPQQDARDAELLDWVEKNPGNIGPVFDEVRTPRTDGSGEVDRELVHRGWWALDTGTCYPTLRDAAIAAKKEQP